MNIELEVGKLVYNKVNRLKSEVIRVRELKFGVEIECFKSFCSQESIDDLYLKLKTAGIAVTSRIMSYGYNMTVGGWQLTYDRTVNEEGYGRGLEVISPVLCGDDGLKQLKIVLRVLNEARFKVDSTCGFHVHHDAEGYTRQGVASILALYYNHQAGIDTLINRNRHGNTSKYCKDMSRDTLAELKAQSVKNESTLHTLIKTYTERMCVVNAQAYLKRGTIEFRQHHGTLDYEEVEGWVLLTNKMMEYAISVDETLNDDNTGSLEELLTKLELDAIICEKLLERSVMRESKIKVNTQWSQLALAC